MFLFILFLFPFTQTFPIFLVLVQIFSNIPLDVPLRFKYILYMYTCARMNITITIFQFNSIQFNSPIQWEFQFHQFTNFCWYWSVYFSFILCTLFWNLCILPNSMNRRNWWLVYRWLWSQYTIVTGYHLKMCNCHIFWTKPCSMISHLLVSCQIILNNTFL